MAKTENIEPRTDEFIYALNLLKTNGVIDNNEEFAKSLGYKSGSGLSEILGRRQNISPKKWASFNKTYGEKIAEFSEPSLPHAKIVDSGIQPNVETQLLSPEQIMSILARSVSRQEITANNQSETLKVLAKVLDRIENKMAQESTQAKIDAAVKALEGKTKEIDTNLIRTLAGVERIAIVQDRSQKELLAHLAKLKSDKNPPSQDEDKSKRQIGVDGRRRGKSPA